MKSFGIITTWAVVVFLMVLGFAAGLRQDWAEGAYFHALAALTVVIDMACARRPR